MSDTTRIFAEDGTGIANGANAIPSIPPAQGGERVTICYSCDTAWHPFVPSATDSALCRDCGEHTSWHPLATLQAAAVAAIEALEAAQRTLSGIGATTNWLAVEETE